MKVVVRGEAREGEDDFPSKWHTFFYITTAQKTFEVRAGGMS